MRRLLVLDVAALGADLLRRNGVDTIAGLPVQSIGSVSPAVTCVAQATLRTARPPEGHGIPANGLFLRETLQTQFWCQSANLVRGARIWEPFRERGGRVGMYFFQQSLGEAVDEVVSPAPIHTHGGGMIMATYQWPENIFGLANPVRLWRYWGPLASPKVGRGIANALSARIRRGDAPELIFAYLPTLDYELQRHGTSHPKVADSLREALGQIETVVTAAHEQAYAIVIIGDYAITDVTGTVAFPNRALRAADLFATRPVRAMRYPDLYRSRAIALCDHQVAPIYCRDAEARQRAHDVLAALPEVDLVRPGQAGADLEIVAKPGCWFAWPWWDTPREAPDYATHVDIHNKPGFDPCELFFGSNPFHCSANVTRVRGTHGRADAPIALATDLSFDTPPTDFLAFSRSLAAWAQTP